MSAFLDVVAIIACALCGFSCFAVAAAGLTSSDEEDDYRITGVTVAVVPGILFGATTAHLIINF